MNVELTKWNETDIDELAALANNKNISATLRDRFPNPYTREDAKWWIDFQKNLDPQQNFAIRMDDKLAGGIGCDPQHDVNRKSIEIGYWLGEQFWKKGIAAEAVKKMTEYIFSNFDVVRIFAPVFEINKPSMKVLEKAGFHLEAIHKKAVIKNEVIMDEYLYVKLK